MVVTRLVPAIVFFLLIGGPILFQPRDAQAWGCCYCGECHWYCNCAGSIDMCPYCRADAMKSPTVLGTALSPETQLEVAQGLVNLSGVKKCVRRYFTARLLGNTEDAVKLASIEFDQSSFEDNTLAFPFKASERETSAKKTD